MHAVTDVTGFALIGHVLEMCRGASLAATLHMNDIPVLAGAAALAEAGLKTGAGDRNWASYSDAVHLPPDLPEWRKALLCDPQTSGGLLIAVAPDKAEDLIATLHRMGILMPPGLACCMPGRRSCISSDRYGASLLRVLTDLVRDAAFTTCEA